MGLRDLLGSWPVYQQLVGPDRLGRGAAAQSPRSQAAEPRTATADRVAKSVCPYCAVGCAQQVFVKDEKVIQIEGNPASPVSRGRLCPKGSASTQLVTGPQREQKVRYRAPGATEWTDLDLHTAMEMVADRVLDARRRGWQQTDDEGVPRWTTRRTTSSRSCSPRWAPSRSRTRRVFDTPPPFPVWEPASVVAAPRTSCRTCPTLTASSSRAPTWPRPTRWASSG